MDQTSETYLASLVEGLAVRRFCCSPLIVLVIDPLGLTALRHPNLIAQSDPSRQCDRGAFD